MDSYNLQRNSLISLQNGHVSISICPSLILFTPFGLIPRCEHIRCVKIFTSSLTCELIRRLDSNTFTLFVSGSDMWTSHSVNAWNYSLFGVRYWLMKYYGQQRYSLISAWKWHVRVSICPWLMLFTPFCLTPRCEHVRSTKIFTCSLTCGFSEGPDSSKFTILCLKLTCGVGGSAKKFSHYCSVSTCERLNLSVHESIHSFVSWNDVKTLKFAWCIDLFTLLDLILTCESFLIRSIRGDIHALISDNDMWAPWPSRFKGIHAFVFEVDIWELYDWLDVWNIHSLIPELTREILGLPESKVFTKIFTRAQSRVQCL